MKAATVGVGLASASSSVQAQLARSEATNRFKIKNKRIRQSIMGWTFNPMPTEELISACVEIGLTGIEKKVRNIHEEAFQGNDNVLHEIKPTLNFHFSFDEFDCDAK